MWKQVPTKPDRSRGLGLRRLTRRRLAANRAKLRSFKRHSTDVIQQRYGHLTKCEHSHEVALITTSLANRNAARIEDDGKQDATVYRRVDFTLLSPAIASRPAGK